MYNEREGRKRAKKSKKDFESLEQVLTIRRLAFVNMHGPCSGPYLDIAIVMYRLPWLRSRDMTATKRQKDRPVGDTFATRTVGIHQSIPGRFNRPNWTWKSRNTQENIPRTIHCKATGECIQLIYILLASVA